MAINAIIDNVSRNHDGTATLWLVAFNDDPPGQNSLVVLNPPPHLEAAIGTHIWGGGDSIIINETKWADRVGYGSIRLVEKKT